MFLGVATRPTEDGPPFNKTAHYTTSAALPNKKRSGSEEMRTGYKSQGVTARREREDVVWLQIVNRISEIVNDYRLLEFAISVFRYPMSDILNFEP
jgi:hypothetical protein